MSTPSIPEPVVEYVDDTPAPRPTLEFRGRRFGVSDAPVPFLSLMKLATLAKRQRDAAANGQAPNPADAEESMAILYDLVRSLIVDDEWPAFEAHANRVGAGMDEFQSIIQKAVEARAARPTQPPSGSPGGQPPTGPNWGGGSSAPGSSIRQGDVRVQTDLEQRGRPDLALVVKRAREASTAS